jgi:hypothetical protein
MIGKKMGSLLIFEFAGTRGSAQHALWRCKCDCGNETVASGAYLRNGRIKSCGCGMKKTQFTKEKTTTHGMSRTRTYKIWRGMVARTTTKTDKSHLYFDRGIRTCDRWLSFENFYADMGKAPDGMSIDRIDNNKGYEPGNCRWATSVEQNNNTRRNRLITARGESMTIAMWARKIGIKPNTIYYRLRRGWTPEEATIP